MTKQRFIYLEGEKIPVSEELYLAYYRPLWRERSYARARGICTQEDFRRCCYDCGSCRYNRGHATPSLDDLCDEYGDFMTSQLPDAPYNPDLIDEIATELAIQVIHERLDKLCAEDKAICDSILNGLTEREAAEQLGMAKTSYRRKKEALLQRLRKDWEDLGNIVL